MRLEVAEVLSKRDMVTSGIITLVNCQKRKETPCPPLRLYMPLRRVTVDNLSINNTYIYS